MSNFSEITFLDKGPEDEPFCFRLYSLIQAERLGWTNSADPQVEALLKLTYGGFRQTYAHVLPPSQDQIVLRAGAPIGRLIVLQTPEEVRLADISLLPECRHQGIGTHCLQRVIKSARKKNLPLRLQTARTNVAQQLYERLGFTATEVGELDLEMEMK